MPVWPRGGSEVEAADAHQIFDVRPEAVEVIPGVDRAALAGILAQHAAKSRRAVIIKVAPPDFDSQAIQYSRQTVGMSGFDPRRWPTDSLKNRSSIEIEIGEPATNDNRRATLGGSRRDLRIDRGSTGATSSVAKMS